MKRQNAYIFMNNKKKNCVAKGKSVYGLKSDLLTDSTAIKILSTDVMLSF